MPERGFGGPPPGIKITHRLPEGDGEEFIMGEFPLEPHELEAHRKMYFDLSREVGLVDEEMRVLKEKSERLREKMRAIQEIPRLFDIADFDTISARLDGLEAAGVDEIKIGERVFTVTEIRDRVKFVRTIAEKITKGESELKTSEQIDSKLAELGVTRAMISPTSKNSFRDAMKKCITEYSLNYTMLHNTL